MIEQAGQPPQPQQGVLIIAFDLTTGNAGYRFEGGPIPHALLVNMLELIKSDAIDKQIAAMRATRAAPPRPGLVLSDGSPAPGS